MAAVFNLNHHSTYVHWHFIELSVSNLLVVAAMLLVFALAILLPFPHHEGVGGQAAVGGAADPGAGSGGPGAGDQA